MQPKLIQPKKEHTSELQIVALSQAIPAMRPIYANAP